MRRLEPQHPAAGLRSLGRTLLVGLWAVLLAPVLALRAEQVFYDRAAVVDVRPIVEQIRRPVTQEFCAPTAVSSLGRRMLEDWAGEVRSHTTGLSLTAALREDHRLYMRISARPCHRLAIMKETAMTVGYRVRYRYGGRILVRRMSEHPGDWVDVRVTLGTPR